MIGLLGEHSAAFLRVFAVITLLAFAIPIAVAPLAWARALKWDIDPKFHLARFYFGLQIGIALLVGIAHVVGAIQRVQPWTETAEIAFWAALVLLGLLFFPSLPG